MVYAVTQSELNEIQRRNRMNYEQFLFALHLELRLKWLLKPININK